MGIMIMQANTIAAFILYLLHIYISVNIKFIFIYTRIYKNLKSTLVKKHLARLLLIEYN